MSIKSSKISLKEINSNKKQLLSVFISEYKIAIKFYVDYLWNNRIEFASNRVLDIQNDLLDYPNLGLTIKIPFKSLLSARALKCASTQACGIVAAQLSKRKKLLYILQKLKEENKRTRSITKKLNRLKLEKPNLTDCYPELNSICCNYSDANGIKYFDAVITLSSIGKSFGKILLPVKHTAHSRKLAAKGKLLKSFLLKPNSIHFRYKLTAPAAKTTGKIVGADSGMKTCLSLSNNQETTACIHGHTVDSICKKIARKKKSSKAFHRALQHKINYIGWAVKQLNLTGIKQINLEQISNFRKGKNVGKYLNYGGETLIKERLIDYAEENGVRLDLQNSAFRSQRCNPCGYVCSKNRKGKLFRCKRCSFQADADYNASCNHEQPLPSAAFLLQLKDRPKEFFWKESGFFDLLGKEITVPCKPNK